jgi:hypothetical protein
MSTIALRTPALLASFVLLSSSRFAYAAPCGRPDVDLTFPPNEAVSVPNNAHLAAHYAAPAVYDDEPVSVTDSAGNAAAVAVSYDEADSMLRAIPEQPLGEGTYEVVWPALRGVSGTAGVGRGRTTSFSVGSATDAAPPVFSGLSGATWDLSRDRDDCLDRLDDRFVFTLQVGEGSDDSGVDLLALLVFQTRDPMSSAQTEPSKVGLRAWPKDGALEVRRPASKAGPTCFAAIAQDLLGNVSGGGEREVCVKTKEAPFFDGCGVAARGAGTPPSFGTWGHGLALIALGLLRRGRAPHARKRRGH